MQKTAFGEIKDNYKIFMEEWKNEHHRFRSYDYCKEYFDAHYGKKMTATEVEIVYDECALRLFSYLLSWGMYRGNDWLIWKSYKVFIPVIEALFRFNYVSIDPLDKNFSIEEYCNQVLDLQQCVFDTLKDVLQKDNQWAIEPKKNEISPLMVNKILMGTFGCVIAYDSYDNKALRHLGKFAYGSQKFENETSKEVRKKLLQKTCELIGENDEFLLQTVADINRNMKSTSHPVRYTVFKVLDMILWEYGK